MAGNNLKPDGDRRQPSSTTTRPPSNSSAVQKSRRENPSPKPVPTTSNKPVPNKPNPNPSPSQLGPRQPPGPQPHPHPPFAFHELPPRPTYGFQMLDRRTIILVDGTVRSYFALPPDYHDIPLQLRFNPPRLLPGGMDHPMKRKFEEEMDRERQKQQVLQYGGNVRPSSPFKEARPSKVMKFGGGGSSSNSNSNLSIKADPAITKAFLNYVNLIYANVDTKRSLLGNGKHGRVRCLACGGSSKDFPDGHSLLMHAYNSDNPNSRVDHLGLHKALCALMGWNCMRVPDDSRVYQFLPADEAAALQDDLIMWPPTVIIHNTNTGKGKIGRMEGLGNKAMDSYIRELGFSGGKSKSLYNNKEGHLGMTLVKFAGDQLGLKEAMNLSEHFQKDRHGRKDWAHLQSTCMLRDDENNPNLVTVDERTREKKKVLYGYLLTAFDLEKLDHETRKKSTVESKLEKLHAFK